MPDPFTHALLTKARTIGGPFVAVLMLAAAIGWALRGNRAEGEALRAQVARLDSTTVKKDTFAAFTLELHQTHATADSTRALLRRLVCRQYRDICP